jgi:hypothetical protein
MLALAGVSLALAVGWSWLKSRPGINETCSRLEEQGWGAAARFFYWVGLPYLAVLLGLISPRLLGLKGLEYFNAISLDAAWAGWLSGNQWQQALSLFLLEAAVDASAMARLGFVFLLVIVGIRLSLVQAGLAWPGDFRPSILPIVYESLHWAFYRAIFWGLSSDLYLGVIFGLAWVGLEWIGLAYWQRQPGGTSSFWAKLIILILTATLFFYTPNLWVLWVFHLAMVALITAGCVQILGKERITSQ